VVALAGIVVNNSIVLIDTYQRLLASGMDKVDVILKTCGAASAPDFADHRHHHDWAVPYGHSGLD
jgi:hypothetical protein